MHKSVTMHIPCMARPGYEAMAHSSTFAFRPPSYESTIKTSCFMISLSSQKPTWIASCLSNGLSGDMPMLHHTSLVLCLWWLEDMMMMKHNVLWLWMPFTERCVVEWRTNSVEAGIITLVHIFNRTLHYLFYTWIYDNNLVNMLK